MPQQPEPTPLTLPEIREQLLRLAGELGPHCEEEAPDSELHKALVDINTAAMRVRATHKVRQTPRGPVQ